MFFEWLVDWLVGWGCGISTIVGYLMANPFIYKKQLSLAKVFCLSKTFLFQAIQFSQKVQIQTIPFRINIVFVHIVKCQSSSLLNYSIQRCIVSMKKTVLFQEIQFNISTQFKY